MLWSVGQTVASVRALIGAGAGNDRCADCGAGQPDWAVINRGLVLCQQCAGAHRSLGTHISKARRRPHLSCPLVGLVFMFDGDRKTCTTLDSIDEEIDFVCQVRHLVLDTDAWTPSVRQLFAQSGNAAGNAVWQSGARTHIAAAAWELVRAYHRRTPLCTQLVSRFAFAAVLNRSLGSGGDARDSRVASRPRQHKQRSAQHSMASDDWDACKYHLSDRYGPHIHIHFDLDTQSHRP